MGKEHIYQSSNQKCNVACYIENDNRYSANRIYDNKNRIQQAEIKCIELLLQKRETILHLRI